jgi:diguanylate cyclase (GGDEF)-like protein
MNPHDAVVTIAANHRPGALPHRPPGPAQSARQAYLDFQGMQEAHTVRQLHIERRPVTNSANCCDVLNRFLADDSLYAIPVVDHCAEPLALIERHAFIEYFSRPYSIELFGRKPLACLGAIAAVINRQPIIVNASTSIDDVAALIIDAGMQHMVSGFIVTEERKYLGIANGHALLNHITQRKQAELYYLAHYDQLTRIPNRMLLNDRLQMACREAQRNNTLVGLMFVDLDRFKQINDTLGHSFGDLVLQAVAERLESCVRGHDTVARLGGDEFAVLLQSLPDADQAQASAKRIVDQFRLPFRILEHEIFITVSLGIALYPRDEQQIDKLYAIADAAMYEAKASGRNAFRHYVPGLLLQTGDHSSLETDLRYAIDRNELVLNYQPQVNVQSGEVVGVEALIRWQHPVRGLLPPSAFIGIAEESGLIIDVGNWVLRQACSQHCAWVQGGMAPLRMSVNVSALQFRRRNFSEIVQAIIDETGIDPGCLELELTESIAMHRADDVLATLRELKRIGVRLAIDDFGTGFSNLSYLQRFPIDRLKIDQSFIRGIEYMPANKSIVEAIVALARSLSLKTVAEGVESALELALTAACDETQGFFHARPMAAAELATWLSARPRGAATLAIPAAGGAGEMAAAPLH